MPTKRSKPGRRAKKKPPARSVQSTQFDLFAQFVTDNPVEVSNTIEIWETIPKYFLTPRQVEKLRTQNGHANPIKWSYQDNMEIKIQPALVEQADGRFLAFFPGVTEELVEEALKKILSDQHYGTHLPDQTETWVRFSLQMIKRELQAKHRSRSIDEIKHAVEVMASCVLTLSKDGKEIWKGSILQDLVTVGREEYLSDTNALHVARLPLFISQAINRLDYRQYNYHHYLECNEQLTRWLYKQLIHRYRQASDSNTYHFLYSTLARSSALLRQTRPVDNRRKVISALEELKRCKILRSYRAQMEKHGSKIMDVKYTIKPSLEFIDEQKAANRRSRQQTFLTMKQGCE